MNTVIDEAVEEAIFEMQEMLISKTDGFHPVGAKLEPYRRLAEFPIDGLYVPGLPNRDAKIDVSRLNLIYITVPKEVYNGRE